MTTLQAKLNDCTCVHSKSHMITTKKAGPVEPHRSRLYNHFVPVYQGLWPAVAKKNMRVALRELNIASGSAVLEVGVGTGVSLECYPRDIVLTGVDLSESMLQEARQLIENREWSNIDVLQMNAEELTFEDSSFDVVTSFHTISVVSQPDAMMSEIVRVTKPGGRILLVNHFRSGNPLIAKVVDSAGNFTRRLGWRTDLDVQSVVAKHPLNIDQCYKPTSMSIFTVMQATVTKDASVAV